MSQGSKAFDKYVKKMSSYSADIISAAQYSWSNIDFKQNEPEIIKDYLLKRRVGVDHLNSSLAAKIQRETNYEIKFSSVFVHQKPRIVRLPSEKLICKGSTDSCELGDVLFIFAFIDKNKIPIVTTAHLMQAKKKAELDSLSQQCLYESDIEFDMPKSILKVSKNKIDVRRQFPGYKSGRSKALSYLIIESKSKVAVGNIPFNKNVLYPFSYFLQRFICSDTGLPFSNSSKGWSLLINDLINVGAAALPIKKMRGYNLNHLINKFNRFDDLHESQFVTNDDPGVPILLIIVRDTELEIKSS